ALRYPSTRARLHNMCVGPLMVAIRVWPSSMRCWVAARPPAQFVVPTAGTSWERSPTGSTTATGTPSAFNWDRCSGDSSDSTSTTPSVPRARTLSSQRRPGRSLSLRTAETTTPTPCSWAACSTPARICIAQELSRSWKTRSIRPTAWRPGERRCRYWCCSRSCSMWRRASSGHGPPQGSGTRLPHHPRPKGFDKSFGVECGALSFSLADRTRLSWGLSQGCECCYLNETSGGLTEIFDTPSVFIPKTLEKFRSSAAVVEIPLKLTRGRCPVHETHNPDPHARQRPGGARARPHDRVRDLRTRR